jgi:hypothetical protein
MNMGRKIKIIQRVGLGLSPHISVHMGMGGGIIHKALHLLLETIRMSDYSSSHNTQTINKAVCLIQHPTHHILLIKPPR